MADQINFYNSRTVNCSLLLLSNIRGEKEAFYKQLKFAAIFAEKEQNAPQQKPAHDGRPFMDYYDINIVEMLVSTFEESATRKKYQSYNEGSDNTTYDNMHYQEVFDKIMAQEELIPIAANTDFNEAMLLLYKDYCLKKIAEHLPLAHEQ